jgi:hypothetical protein
MTHSPLVMLYLFHVHVILSILGILGVFLLYRWAVTSLKPAALRTLAFWCVGIGLVGVFLTVPFCLAGWRLMVPAHTAAAPPR